MQNEQPNMQITKPMEPTYTAGIYARISSDEYLNGVSVENQIHIAEDFIKLNPYIRLHRIYIDRGVSSFAPVRPAFNDMLNDIQNGTINCIIVKDISRFSRDNLEAGDLLQKTFPVWKTRFISINDNFDSLYADATELKMVLRSFAAYMFSADMSKKIKGTINARQKAGMYVPPKLPYGYMKVRSGNGVDWKIDDTKSEVVKGIFTLALEDNSPYKIARILNDNFTPAPNGELWTSSSVRRILKNESYIGMFITGKTHNRLTMQPRTIPVDHSEWIRHENHHVSIIDEDIFYKVQKMLQQRLVPISKIRTENDFFCGKLYCGICGRKMKMKRSANGSTYYICSRRNEIGGCSNSAKSASKIKQLVYEQVKLKIDEAMEYREKMLQFESSPYFVHWEREQDLKLEKLKSELEHQHLLFRNIFKDTVIAGTDKTANAHNLQAHLSVVRNNLNQQINEVEAALHNYWANESSKRNVVREYLEFADVDCLSKEMVIKLVGRVYFNVDELIMDCTFASAVGE